MFHIFDTVQVAVYIQVAVFHTVKLSGCIVFHRSDLSGFLDRTRTVGHIRTQSLHIEQGRTTRFHIDRSPDRAGKAKSLTFAVYQLKATAGE